MIKEFTIYGRPGCVYCEKAKIHCDEIEADFIYKQLDVDYTREELMSMNPEFKTFPQVYEGGKLIGGFSELRDTYPVQRKEVI